MNVVNIVLTQQHCVVASQDSVKQTSQPSFIRISSVEGATKKPSQARKSPDYQPARGKQRRKSERSKVKCFVCEFRCFAAEILPWPQRATRNYSYAAPLQLANFIDYVWLYGRRKDVCEICNRWHCWQSGLVIIEGCDEPARIAETEIVWVATSPYKRPTDDKKLRSRSAVLGE